MPSVAELKGSLKELIQRFDELVEDFYRDHHPARSSDYFREGPCLYFHQATIQHVRQQLRPFAEWLPDDQRCHELLYATLIAWGMNSTTEDGPKLKDFEEFRHAVSSLASLESLEKCRPIELDGLTHQRQPLIRELVETLADPASGKVMKGGAFVVGGSKLLHHLLPDLIPPIDNKFTFGLIGWLADDNRLQGGQLENFEAVWHILMFFRKVLDGVTAEHIRKRWLSDERKYPMNTSIPAPVQ